VADSDTTKTLAEFCANLQYDAIPQAVRERCKDFLLDAIGCAIAGHRSLDIPQVLTLASSLGRSTESTVIGGNRLSLAGATLANGYLITALTMCDVNRVTGNVLTPEVVPPALGLAERDALPGRELLVALAAGLEASARIEAGLNFPDFRKRSWAAPGVIGPFGAAVAVARLLTLSPDGMSAAIGLAGSQASGTYAAWRTPTIKFHACRGALSGLMAGILAAQEFGATREFLTASDGGLYRTYCDGGDLEAVVGALGERWEFQRYSFRPWPVAGAIQGVVTAALDLVTTHDIRPAEVKKVSVGLSKWAYDLHAGFPIIQRRLWAMLSAHYAVAVVVHEREFWLEHLEPQRYTDLALQDFSANKISMVIDPRLVDSQTIVQVDTMDRGSFTTRCDAPLGTPDNPLTREQVIDKFRKCTKGVLSEERARALMEAILAIEHVDSAESLMRLTACAER
jgi:2-methylcitrate dehydratase PrpD